MKFDGRILVGICGVAGATLLLAAQPDSGLGDNSTLNVSPATTFVTAPLQPNGDPDYVAYVDQKVAEGVAADENFWVLLDGILPRQGLGTWYADELTKRPGFENVLTTEPRFTPPLDIATLSNAEGHSGDVLSMTWTREQSPETVAWLEGNAEALAIAIEAARRPKAYAPLIARSEDRTLASVLLPHVQEARGIVRALTARALWSLGEGRSPDAWNDVLAVHRMSRHLWSEPFEVERLGGLAYRGQITTATVLCLSDPATNEDQLLARWRELAPLLDSSNVDHSLEAERLVMLSFVLGLKNSAVPLDNLGLPRVTASNGLLSLFDPDVRERKVLEMRTSGGDINARLELCNRYFNGIESAMALATFPERQRALDELGKKLDLGVDLTLDELAKQIVEGSNPDRDVVRLVLKQGESFRGLVNTTETTYQARAMLLHAAVAAELHFRSQGADVADGAALRAAAADLGALAGISNLPRIDDPFTGKDLIVQRTPKSLRIVSVGRNGQLDAEDAAGDDLAVELRRASR